jgi:nicotinamidase-related amidase
MQKPVLIVIDMLNDFLDPWDSKRKGQLVDSINELAIALRKASHPVVWVRQEFEPDLSDAFAEMRAKDIHVTIKGTLGCQILPELAVDPADLVIVKKRYSAFFGTDLDSILEQFRPDPLILAGINTHACIRTTAIDAYQRDWPVVLAQDCIDSYDRPHHEMTVKYLKDKIALVLTNREIMSSLGSDG